MGGDLIDSYKESRQLLVQSRGQLEAEIELYAGLEFEDLKKSAHNDKYKELKTEHIELFEDLKLINSMIRDCEYVIEWLERGRQPGLRRGIERRSVYQNTVHLDPVVLTRYIGNRSVFKETKPSSNIANFKIEQALQDLSQSERKIYLMSVCYGMSQREIAKETGVSNSSIATLIQRAKAKINRQLETNIFLREVSQL